MIFPRCMLSPLLQMVNAYPDWISLSEIQCSQTGETPQLQVVLPQPNPISILILSATPFPISPPSSSPSSSPSTTQSTTPSTTPSYPHHAPIPYVLFLPFSGYVDRLLGGWRDADADTRRCDSLNTERNSRTIRFARSRQKCSVTVYRGITCDPVYAVKRGEAGAETTEPESYCTREYPISISMLYCTGTSCR